MGFSGFYTYLISSLPMLHFSNRPPFSYQEFLKKCREFVPEQANALLEGLPGSQDDLLPPGDSSVVKKWLSWDAALRDELVKLRAARLHLFPQKYLRADGFQDLSLSHIAVNAFRNPSIIEAEKMLDSARWEALEGFAQGHYFDLDFLVIYAYKLLILERWEKIRVSDKKELLQAALS